nr:ABC transporter permease [uncultured Dethiosulfovibrio sp.]
MISYLRSHGDQVWEAFTTHIMLFGASMFFAIFLGMVIGIFVAADGNRRVGNVVLTALGAAQATPSIAVVALSFLFVGIGAAPAIIALVVYCLVPIVFNVVSGLLGVPEEAVEAARGLGMTDRQILWKVKMPLASRVIMSGIRSAATINVGTATVAAVIGGGGLGDIIFSGLKMERTEAILVGAGLSALLAIAIDGCFGQLERRLVPKGLTIEK